MTSNLPRHNFEFSSIHALSELALIDVNTSSTSALTDPKHRLTLYLTVNGCSWSYLTLNLRFDMEASFIRNVSHSKRWSGRIVVDATMFWYAKTRHEDTHQSTKQSSVTSKTYRRRLEVDEPHEKYNPLSAHGRLRCGLESCEYGEELREYPSPFCWKNKHFVRGSLVANGYKVIGSGERGVLWRL